MTQTTERDRPDDPNWQQIVLSLVAAGMTQTVIADRLGVTQGTVSNLATGRTKSVEWSIGQALLDLQASNAPRMSSTEPESV